MYQFQSMYLYSIHVVNALNATIISRTANLRYAFSCVRSLHFEIANDKCAEVMVFFFRILVPLFIMMLSVAISSSRPIYNYHLQSRRLYDHHTGYNNYDYDYYDYTDNHHAASSQQRQIQLDTFADLNIAERVSGALATLSIIGLSYLSSRSRTADLQLQINSLTNSVTSLQNSIYSLQSQISTLSSTSASSSSVSSAVLESTCTTVSILP